MNTGYMHVIRNERVLSFSSSRDIKANVSLFLLLQVSSTFRIKKNICLFQLSAISLVNEWLGQSVDMMVKHI